MFLITLSSPSAAGKISKGLSSHIWTINEQTWSRGDIWKWAVCRPLSELIVSCFQHTGVHCDHSWFNTLAVFKVIHRYITSTKHNNIKYCCIFCHSLCLSVCSSISIYLSIYLFFRLMNFSAHCSRSDQYRDSWDIFRPFHASLGPDVL